MSDYRIKSGDTLSSIAKRHNTDVGALMKANPNIKNADLIYADAKLNIPGSKDDFQAQGTGAKGPDLTGGSQASQTEGSSGAQPVGKMPPGQVGDWIKQATDILKANGVPADKMDPQAIAAIIQHESSGNPNAINNWDSNAQKGTPSIGLMQTIQPTFDAHKLPGHDDIRNPVDNIIAAVRYSISRYGSISNVPGVKNLQNGSGYVGY